MSATDSQIPNRILIDELGRRFPLLSQFVGMFGQETQEERFPWFFGLLLAAATNPNPGACCVVLDKTLGTTAIAAILLSLVRLQEGFEKLVADYAQNALVPGQLVRVNPSKFIYDYQGFWEKGPGLFRLKVLGEEAYRSFPIPDVLRLEPTDRVRPKGTLTSKLGEFELSNLSKLLHLTTGGNNSLIRNSVLVQIERSQFSEVADLVMLAPQSGGQFDHISELLPWGSVGADGALRPNDTYQVSGEPLVAVTRIPEDLATACLKSPKSTKVVLIDGASRIAGHLQAYDDIADRQRLVVLASPEEGEALGFLRARGCPVWNMSAQEVLIGEESPELRTRGSLAGGSIRAADIRRRAKVTAVECSDETLQKVAGILERVSAMVSGNGDGQDIEIDLLARLFGIVFECSESCFGVGEEVKDNLRSISAQIQMEKAWMRPGVAIGLIEAVNVLEKVMDNQYVSQKAEALLHILFEHVDEVRKGQWAIAARTQRTARPPRS